jgi:DNA replication and repair protein RecF
VIHTLSLSHFRNYAAASLQAAGESIILSGPNGAGKTNILEAISLLSPGRGLRRAKLPLLRHAAHPGKPWAVAAFCDGLQGEVQLGIGHDQRAESEKRLVKIDGKAATSQTALAEHLAMIWLTPQMDGLFLDTPGTRRRFLDRLVYAFDPAHLTRVNAYELAMRERNRLLSEPRPDAIWLSALETRMSEHGMALSIARLQFNDQLQQSMQHITDAFPKARLQLSGGIETWLNEGMHAADTEEAFREQLARNRMSDARAARTTSGPHTSDWDVFHTGKNMPAAACSTGEQKALLLSILLSQATTRKQLKGRAPLLLLDEVVAHLDASRRAALSLAIQQLDTQVWLTGTDSADFSDFSSFCQHYRVEDGALTPAG